MVTRCRAVGVEIYVDAVLNHMAFAPGGIGVAGTSFTKYDYPGLYIDADFHQCKHGIEDYGSRYEIQSCELATLPDLATESDYVRDRLTDYLQHLVDLGVGGFRIDAAKHIPADDLRIITDGLDRPVFLFGEVINLSPSEVVSFAEYTDFAKVTEFRYSLELSRVFREGQVAWLEQFGEVWEMMPSADAVVFVDNHDNQRGHAAGDPITHGDPELYRLANIFMLAWPYGYPQVMSSYAFSDADEGPPLHPSGGVLPPHTASGECVDPWVCEHRWPAIRNMVGFRNATTDAPGIEHWWTNGANQIAFSRGDRGFVMINREDAATSARSFETGLPAGMYCDVVSGAIDPAHRSCSGLVIEVDTAGRAIFEVGALDAVAIHVESRIAE
jgi:alpha-amylase